MNSNLSASISSIIRSVMRTPQASATALATAAAGTLPSFPMAKLLYGPGPAGTYSMTAVLSGGISVKLGILNSRTAEAPTPQHIRQLQIGAVLRLPGNLEFALDPRCWPSHNLHHLLTSEKLNYDGLAAARSSLLNQNAPRCPAIRKNKHPTWQTGSIWLSFCLAVRRTQRTNCA